MSKNNNLDHENNENKDKLKPIVTNGLTRKMHTYQITSFVMFFGDILVFYLFLVPLLHNAAKIAACIIFMFPCVSTVYYALICTKVDPTDKNVTSLRKAQHEGREFEPTNKEFYCSYCTIYVNGSSRHCKRCDRCVDNFDHHCKWVNNCVGGANYKQFFKMISSVFIFAATYLAFMIVATINFAQDRFASTQNTYSNKLSVGIGLMVVVWAFSIPTILLMILDFNLVAFHLYLMKIKMTTFDYIIYTQEKKEQAESARGQKKEEKLKEKEQLRLPNDERKPEKTCFDFVLCLNKKHKTRRREATEQNMGTEVKTLNDESPNQRGPEQVKVGVTLEQTNINKAAEEEVISAKNLKNPLIESKVKATPKGGDTYGLGEENYGPEGHANEIMINADISVKIEPEHWNLEHDIEEPKSDHKPKPEQK